MNSQKVARTLIVKVPHREEKEKREALVKVKYGSFIFNAPSNRTSNKDGNYLPDIKINAIYVF